MYALLTNISFYLSLTILLTSVLLLTISLRKKFFFYLIIIFLFNFWGFLFNLDGMMLVLLTTEFTVVLFLLMTYIQLYANYTFYIKKLKYKLFIVLTLLWLVFIVNNNEYYFYSTYSIYKLISHIVTSDFYILFYFLFEKNLLLVIFLTLIISLFSLFFIILYFNLKQIKYNKYINIKNTFFLRKQNLKKQTTYKSKLYTFQI